MDPIVLAPVMVFVVVLIAAYLLLARAGERENPIARRLEGGAPRREPVAQKKAAEPVSLLRDSAVAPTSPLLRVVKGSPASRSAAVDLKQADLAIDPALYLVGRFVPAVLAAALAVAGFVPPLAGIAIAVAGWFVPRFVVRRKAKKRTDAFEAQLAEALDLLSGALRAGHGFLQAIESTAHEMASPMKDELLRLIDAVNVGGSVDAALQELPNRIDSYDVQLMASAIAVQRQAGGNLAEVLQTLSKTVRERRRIRGEVKALTAAPRMSGYIVGALPFGLTVYFAAVSSDFRASMFGTDIGKAILVGAGVWTLFGFLISQRIAKVEY